MNVETRRRIEETVLGILKKADLDSMTMLSVRAMTAETLGIDLSDITYKMFIRNLVDSFLLSIEGDDDDDISPDAVDAAALRTDSVAPPRVFPEGVVVEEEPEERKTNVAEIDKAAASCGGFSRIICDLSKTRHVTVTGSHGKRAVSITEFHQKYGERVASCKGITLANEQWSIFKKSIPAIEEAITIVKSTIRLKLEQGPNQDTHAKSDTEKVQVVDLNSGAELERQKEILSKPVSFGKKDATTNASSSPSGLAPIEIIRFDGKNYHQWVARIELLLNQLKIAHVLVDPCPSTRGVDGDRSRQIMAAIQKWIDDDYICRLNILNSLSDHLFEQYARKSGSAKDLWEELRLVYFHEEHGLKVSLVKKYIEFQIVEGKSVVDQVQGFHEIADSIVASGMFVEEKFHVNAIISKLPPSWKGFSVKLMKEDHLPVRLLMHYLKLEEEFRGKGSTPESPQHQHTWKLGPNTTVMKKPGILQTYHQPEKDRRVYKFCNICKKKGHIPEQCWFKKSGNKHDSNNFTPHLVTDSNGNKLEQ